VGYLFLSKKGPSEKKHYEPCRPFREGQRGLSCLKKNSTNLINDPLARQSLGKNLLGGGDGPLCVGERNGRHLVKKVRWGEKTRVAGV